MNITKLIIMCGLESHIFETYNGIIRFTSMLMPWKKVIFKQYDDHVLVVVFGFFRVKEEFFVYDDKELPKLMSAIFEVIAPF